MKLSYTNMVPYEGREVDLSTLPIQVRQEMAAKRADRMCEAVNYRREEVKKDAERIY